MIKPPRFGIFSRAASAQQAEEYQKNNMMENFLHFLNNVKSGQLLFPDRPKAHRCDTKERACSLNGLPHSNNRQLHDNQ